MAIKPVAHLIIAATLIGGCSSVDGGIHGPLIVDPIIVTPGVYIIRSLVDPARYVIDLSTDEHAGDGNGVVQAIAGNASDFQRWILEEVPEQPGVYTIRSPIQPNKYLEPNRGTTVAGVHTGSDPNGEGDEIGWYPGAAGAYQQWSFENEGSGHYCITNDGSGTNLTLSPSDDPPRVRQYSASDQQKNQIWIMQAAR